MTVSTPTDVCRSVPFTFARAIGDTGSGTDGLTLEGYAAVFDQRTEIDSWEGSFVETIRKGAFRKTVRERTPVLQFDHGRHPLVGSIPIGRIGTISEDDQGLYVQARLSDNWLIEPVRVAIRDQTITGMSFRFDVVRDEWRDNQGVLLKPGELIDLLYDAGERGPLERTLVEVKVRELGPVVFPAYEATTVSVRAKGIAEQIFHDDAMRRELCRSLVEDTPPPVTVSEDLRREIACAVLFQTTTASEDAVDDEDKDTSEENSRAESNTDAPPTERHPSESDAPPKKGHPSLSERDHRRYYARRAYMTREGVGKRFV